MCFGIVGLFCIINCYFEYGIRIRCTLLYMGTLVKCIFEHFYEHFLNSPRSVNNFRTKDCFGYLWGFGVVNGLDRQRSPG